MPLMATQMATHLTPSTSRLLSLWLQNSINAQIAHTHMIRKCPSSASFPWAQSFKNNTENYNEKTVGRTTGTKKKNLFRSPLFLSSLCANRTVVNTGWIMFKSIGIRRNAIYFPFDPVTSSETTLGPSKVCTFGIPIVTPAKPENTGPSFTRQQPANGRTQFAKRNSFWL